MCGMASDRDWDQIIARCDAVGRIVMHLSGAGKKYLHPRMRGAGADHARRASIERGVIEIAADKTGSEAEPAQRLDHKPGVVLVRASQTAEPTTSAARIAASLRDSATNPESLLGAIWRGTGVVYSKVGSRFATVASAASRDEIEGRRRLSQTPAVAAISAIPSSTASSSHG